MGQLVEKPEPESLLASLNRQLAAMEKRDWELWTLVFGIGIIVAAGLLIVLFPSSIFGTNEIRVQFSVSRELFFGLASVLILFNLYALSRRFEFRRTRQQLISSTIQSELIRLQSFTDPLTEVYNRRSLDEMATRYISRARRLKTPLTFLLIDVDRFKEVNTRFGHLTGDVVLAEIASILRGSVRGTDTVVRYGGDEFLIMLAETDEKNSDHVVHRIEKAVEDWNRGGHLEGFNLTLSVGVAQWEDGQTLDETLDHADRKMYAFKSARSDGA